MQSTSYKDLKIFQKGIELFYRVHPLALKLPKYEMYCLGDQLRRSADSITTNILEGYGRRKYKADYIRYLIYAHSSCLETAHHLEKIRCLYPAFEKETCLLLNECDSLGAGIYKYLQYFQQSWLT